MSIIRSPRPESNFYLLNKAISEDRRLSWAARGLLVYLLGKPDHWQVSVANLRNETKESAKPTGRDGVYAILDELGKAGYITRSQDRNEGGKMGEIHYFVSEKPLTPSPLPDKPYTVEPFPVNPTQVSIDVKQGLKEAVKTEGASALPASRKVKFNPLTAKPSNVSAEAWAEWCGHRQEIRKALTARMCEQQAKALINHPNPDAVLRQSIANGWTGIFPDKVTGAPAMSRHTGFDDRDYTSGLTEREDGSYAF